MLKNDESLKEKFVRKGFWIYLFSFIIGPIGYATKMILSADLTVEQIGVFYGVISLITLVGTYNDLGLTEALQYYLPKFAVAKQYGKFKAALAYAFWAQMLSSVVLGAAFFFFSDFLWTHYFKSAEAAALMKVFCLFFICYNALHIGSTVFASLQQTKRQYFSNFIRSGLSFAFVATLWFAGHGALLNYAWAWIFPLFINIAWNVRVQYSEVYKPYLSDVVADHSDGLFGEIFKYALWTLLASNVGMLLSQVDMQLIIVFLGARDAGYYTNYLSLIGIPFLLVTPLIGFLFPVVSGLAWGKDFSGISSIRLFFTKYFAVAAIPVSLALGFFGSDFAIAFFGTKFAESGRILSWSAPFLIFNFLLQINFQIMAGTGRIRERLRILLVGLAFNVPLNIVLIPAFGASGSALAVGLSWIPLWYLSNAKCAEYPVRFDWAYFARNLAVLVPLSFSLYLLRNSWSPAGLSERAESVFWLGTACLVHIIGFVLANLSEMKEIVSEIRSMFAKKNVSNYSVTTPESGEATP